MDDEVDLATAVTDAYERLCRAVEGLDHAVIEREPAADAWSARDVVAHITDWNEEVLAAAECCLNLRERPTHHPIQDGERYNQEQAALHQDESWEVTKNRLDLVTTDVLACVSRLEPGQTTLETYFPWGGGGTLASLLSGLLGHQAAHTAELEAWRDARRADETPSV